MENMFLKYYKEVREKLNKKLEEYNNHTKKRRKQK